MFEAIEYVRIIRDVCSDNQAQEENVLFLIEMQYRNSISDWLLSASIWNRTLAPVEPLAYYNNFMKMPRPQLCYNKKGGPDDKQFSVRGLQ